MKIFFKWVLPILLAIFLIVWFGGRFLLSYSVADYRGEIHLSGLTSAVEITFDERAIPQVWADTDRDMYFALGWLHASERAFQMELVRRFVSGKLSEIFGSVAFEVDLNQRGLGFARQAQADAVHLDEHSLAVLKAYCEGINAWLEYKSILPPEFIILQFTPRKWTPEDVLGIALYQAWYAHSLMDHDMHYHTLIQKLGDDILRILKEPKDWSPVTVPEKQLVGMFQLSLFPMRMTQASNSWVVAPGKSQSGAALHASDPHLQINQIPGFWYAVGLHSQEGTEVVGVSVPGLPFVVMGHNQDVAYAFTVASVDVIDYYRFQRNPEDSLQILTEKGYQPLLVLEEEVRVKDEKNPRRVHIYQTPLGPVVEHDSTSLLALHWAGYDFDVSSMITAVEKLHHVASFSEFRKIVTRLGALDVNWTYSDRRGNIGYQLGAPIPRRGYENTFTRLPAEDPQFHWQGYYPLEETPFAYNPEQGWLATCNNQIVGKDWPYAIPGFYDPYRITRANVLLAEKSTFTADDLRTMQLDRVSGFALRWKPLLQQAAEHAGHGQLAQAIAAWDGNMSEEQRLPAVFRLWWDSLTKPLYQDQLGEDWKSGRYIQEEVLSSQLASIIDDVSTEKTETLVDIAAMALDSVLADFPSVVYGDISILEPLHPLAGVEMLNRWLNLSRGPVPIGGDKGSLNANFNFWDEQNRRFTAVAGPSMRFVLDWANLDEFTLITNMGQSGNPFSPHYDDFFESMQSGETWVVPFSREKVLQRAKSTLVLTPKMP